MRSTDFASGSLGVMMGEIISSKTWLPDLYIPLMGDSAYVGYWFMHILHSEGQSVILEY